MQKERHEDTDEDAAERAADAFCALSASRFAHVAFRPLPVNLIGYRIVLLGI